MDAGGSGWGGGVGGVHERVGGAHSQPNDTLRTRQPNEHKARMGGKRAWRDKQVNKIMKAAIHSSITDDSTGRTCRLTMMRVNPNQYDGHLKVG